jgi:hypothetical protein
VKISIALSVVAFAVVFVGGMAFSRVPLLYGVLIVAVALYAHTGLLLAAYAARRIETDDD